MGMPRQNPQPDQTLNVFIWDRNGLPIPGATVIFSSRDRIIAESTTAVNLARPVRIQLSPAYKEVTVDVVYKGISRKATVDLNSGNYEFTLNEVVLSPTTEKPSTVAAWIVGFLFISLIIVLVAFGMKD